MRSVRVARRRTVYQSAETCVSRSISGDTAFAPVVRAIHPQTQARRNAVRPTGYAISFASTPAPLLLCSREVFDVDSHQSSPSAAAGPFLACAARAARRLPGALTRRCLRRRCARPAAHQTLPGRSNPVAATSVGILATALTPAVQLLWPTPSSSLIVAPPCPTPSHDISSYYRSPFSLPHTREQPPLHQIASIYASRQRRSTEPLTSHRPNDHLESRNETQRMPDSVRRPVPTRAGAAFATSFSPPCLRLPLPTRACSRCGKRLSRHDGGTAVDGDEVGAAERRRRASIRAIADRGPCNSDSELLAHTDSLFLILPQANHPS